MHNSGVELSQITASARTAKRAQKLPLLSLAAGTAADAGALVAPAPAVDEREPAPELVLVPVPDGEDLVVLVPFEPEPLVVELSAWAPTTRLAHAMRVLLA